MSFNGKKVIVTGGNNSIGREIAIAFAKEGADVVISYCHDEQGAEQTLLSMSQWGGYSRAFQVDFSNNQAVLRFFEQVISCLSHVDILINNAALLNRETLFELSPERMQQIFQVNTIAPFYLTKLCAQEMIERGKKGSLINISSISSSVSRQANIAYPASKSALNQWTKNAAWSLAKHGIRINAILPGIIEAGMNKNTVKTHPERWESYLKNIPLNRAGTPNDIANMALFLASSKAAYVTGKLFEVDGGYAD